MLRQFCSHQEPSILTGWLFVKLTKSSRAFFKDQNRYVHVLGQQWDQVWNTITPFSQQEAKESPIFDDFAEDLPKIRVILVEFDFPVVASELLSEVDKFPFPIVVVVNPNLDPTYHVGVVAIANGQVWVSRRLFESLSSVDRLQLIDETALFLFNHRYLMGDSRAP